ncbi:MAG: thioredoxin domain-containing protein [Acidimicrobiales bacterium]
MPALDVTDATFEAEVLDKSMTVPVVVDLWAPWCGPCRTLGPIIEKVVDDTDGAVVLTKVNVDENPMISQSFGVQSIPAVFALSERNIVSRFVGALPEREVAEFVNGLLPAPSQADELAEQGDEASLRRALEIDPGHSGAVTALAAMLVDKGEPAEALGLLERIPETPETRRIAAKARLPRSDSPDGSWSAGDIDAKVSQLLDRVPGDDDARQQIVDLLETMDPESPRLGELRRALASKLF